MRLVSAFVLALVAVNGAGCAHQPLSGDELASISRPAFISRIEEGAGPRSQVFRDDDSYAPKLKRLAPKEADRRLGARMQEAMTRFEIAERLRATTAAALPDRRPWTHTVNPALVARTLQSFLVDEVPANQPDYQLVRELGADCVVEFVIEEYGMRSEDGKAGAYVLGYGRMFTLDGHELWRRNYEVDQLKSGMGGLNPFAIKDHKEVWRNAMSEMLDAVAIVFAKDLTPHSDGTSAPVPAEEAPARDEQPPPASEEDEIL